MPLFKELDNRMTINIKSETKKTLQELAELEHMSLSKFVLEKIVNEWLKKRESDGRASNVS